MPSVQGRSMLYGFFALNVIDRSLDRTIFQYHNQSGPAASPRRLRAREPTFDTSRRWAFVLRQALAPVLLHFLPNWSDNMIDQVLANSGTTTHSDVSLLRKMIPVVLSIMLGSVILGAVGFAPGVAHNAAHDTRHVMVFPCH